MRKIFLSLATFCCVHVHSQHCTVLTEALKGTYEGGCKNEKADGTGTATGQDSYTGEFKNGYPEGKGKYTWKNGDWFEGEWKKGIREGTGTMHYAEKNPADTLTGFWKKDKYIGRYEKPYNVVYKSRNLGSINVTKENDKDKELLFILKTSFGGAVTLQGQTDKVAITDIGTEKGIFLTRFDDNSNPKTSMTTLRNVTFPIKVRLTMSSDDVLEIEFLEEGKYSINVKVEK
jgi:MORN repeat